MITTTLQQDALPTFSYCRIRVDHCGIENQPPQFQSPWLWKYQRPVGWDDEHVFPVVHRRQTTTFAKEGKKSWLYPGFRTNRELKNPYNKMKESRAIWLVASGTQRTLCKMVSGLSLLYSIVLDGCMSIVNVRCDACLRTDSRDPKRDALGAKVSSLILQQDERIKLGEYICVIQMCRVLVYSILVPLSSAAIESPHIFS